MRERTDEQLMQAAKSCHEAFDQLVERHVSGVLNFFYRLSGKRELAEDLSQEVFLRLYQSRERYQVSGSFRAYLYRIARNLWIDHLRLDKNTRSLCQFSHDFLKNQSHATSVPVEQLANKEKQQALQKSIAQLSYEKRMVFVLYEKGLKFSEIAQVMGIPEGTAKSRLHSCFQKIRQDLQAFF